MEIKEEEKICIIWQGRGIKQVRVDRDGHVITREESVLERMEGVLSRTDE